MFEVSVRSEVKISIIVPIYRIKEEYLRMSIECLIGQTMREIEILLIDDGSPDKSGDICEEYAAKDNRIKVFHQVNSGVSVARNVGIENAIGQYIMFIDPDDWLDIDCCRQVFNIIGIHNCEAVFFQSCFEFGGKTKYFQEKNMWFRDMKQMQIFTLKQAPMKYCCPIDVPWGKVIRRNIITDNGLRFKRGIHISQDGLFNLNLYECLNDIYCMSYTGYHYRQHTDSVNCRYNPDMPSIVKTFILAAEEFILEKHDEDIEYKKALGVRCITMLGPIEKAFFFNESCNLSLKQIYEEYRSYISDDIIGKYLSICKSRDCASWKMKIRCFLLKRGTVGLNIYFIMAFINRKIKRR